MTDYGGHFPRDIQELQKLPGIGPHTAGAIAAYAYNQPALFIETNIRTVIIHHFFARDSKVSDKRIREVLEQILDIEQPREFYYALMDYGTYLKKIVGNLNKLSNSYAKQSTFHGSKRQIRGQVIRLLTTKQRTLAELKQHLPDDRLGVVLQELNHEQLIKHIDQTFSLN